MRTLFTTSRISTGALLSLAVCGSAESSADSTTTFTSTLGQLTNTHTAADQIEAPLGLCQGGCNSSDDCKSGLTCFRRSGNRANVDVPGCSDLPVEDVGYCVTPSQNFTRPTYIGQRGPLGRCAGDCDKDEDCLDGMLCYQRDDKPYDVPFGCEGTPWIAVDYCVEPPADPDEYVPGFLKSTKFGVQLSHGLDIKVIARSGWPVAFASGAESALPFHLLPDFGACFEDQTGRNPGGWAYVSNSEVKNGGGGVGVIMFNANGDVEHYEKLLEGTSRNCGGGVTSWNTFISCEESMNTHCHELDPFGGLVSEDESRTALGGLEGGNFESFASDERGKHHRVPNYYVTEDRSKGPLRRFRPTLGSNNLSSEADPTILDWTNPYRKMLFGNATIDYLVLEPTDDEARQGTFYWTTDKEEAKNSASLHYSNAEGIDVKDGIMHFTARRNTDVFILDLDNANYTRINLPQDGMDLSADQLIRLSGDDSGIIYMTNHGWKAQAGGVYTRDTQGRYSTILESTVNEEGNKMDRLTTGLAFSPGGKYMYVCFQRAGICFAVWRKDGKSFAGSLSNSMRYHL